jgi:hypothetical protein
MGCSSPHLLSIACHLEHQVCVCPASCLYMIYILLWSQQFSIMFFQLAVLTVILPLYWSRPIIARGVRAVSQTTTHHKMRSVLFFVRTCGPRVPNMINYIFSTHLQLSNGKQLFLQQETRPYVS